MGEPEPSQLLVANDEGADVLVLEKVPSDASFGCTVRPSGLSYSGGGGNTCICGGAGGWMPNTAAVQRPMHVRGHGTTPYETGLAFGNAAIGNYDWFQKVGIPCTKSETLSEPEFLGLAGEMEKISISVTPIEGAIVGGHYYFTILIKLCRAEIYQSCLIALPKNWCKIR